MPQVPRLEQAETECVIDANEASYFLSTIDPLPRRRPPNERLAQALFLATAQVTADAADYFGTPSDRTVVMGSRIEV